MRGPPVYGCLVEEAVIVVAQDLEAIQVAASAQALAVADLLDDLQPCADAPVATGAVGKEADLDLGVAAAVHLILIQNLVAGPVDDPGAAVCVGVQKVAACVVLVVLLLVAVTQVEMDPQVVEACRAYLPGNACRMDDRRVHIYFENALKFIRRCEEEYDLIIVDSSDPFGPSEGLFTREFYGSCFNALKEDGIMVNQQGSPFYAEDASAMQRSHKRIASTFPISRVYQAHIPTFAAGYWLFGFASKKYHPIDDLDAAAWKALNMRTRYYTTKLHIGAFYLPAFLEEMLREVEEH